MGSKFPEYFFCRIGATPVRQEARQGPSLCTSGVVVRSLGLSLRQAEHIFRIGRGHWQSGLQFRNRCRYRQSPHLRGLCPSNLRCGGLSLNIQISLIDTLRPFIPVFANGRSFLFQNSEEDCLTWPLSRTSASLQACRTCSLLLWHRPCQRSPNSDVSVLWTYALRCLPCF
jgi:hypothetical protein